MVQSRPSGTTGQESAPPSGAVEAIEFSANRVVFRLPEGASGWLYYADGYDPAWKALVDGQPTEVHRANVGFKAVHVPQGAREVTFFFDAGWRDEHCLAFIAASALLAFAMTGLLFAAPWLLRIGPGPTITPVDNPPLQNLDMLRAWSAFACEAALAGGLLMAGDFCLALLFVPLTAVIILVVHHRHARLGNVPI